MPFRASIRSLLTRQRLVLLSMLLIIVSVVLWVNASPLTAVPSHSERFTELYFTDPAKLPRQATDDTSQEFSFTVVNREDRTVRYRYEVAVVVDGEKYVTDSGAVRIADDRSATETVSVTLPATTLPVSVVVQLLDMPQQISYKAVRE